jgi:hypothetical protein
LLLGVCFGQRPVTQAHNINLGLGLSGGRFFLLDNTISTLTFSGFYKGISANAVIERSNKQEHILYMTVSSGKSTQSCFYKSQTLKINTNLSYTYLHEWFAVGGAYRFSLKSGFDISLFYNDRVYKGYISRKKSFEYNASVGAVIKAVLALNTNPEAWITGSKLIFNPFSFLVQPAFERESISGSSQENEESKFFFKSGKLVGPANFFRLNNELFLQKPVSKTATISIAYLWNFMLETLKDVNVRLLAPFDSGSDQGYFKLYSRNFNFPRIKQRYLKNDYFSFGPLLFKVVDSVGYIYYGSFNENISDNALDSIFKLISKTKELILDMRNNAGRNSTNSEKLFRQFIAKRQLIK